jgi:hypothetical protein
MDLSKSGARSIARQVIKGSLRGAIVNMGTANGKTDPQASGVSDDVTFAPFDPLAHCPAIDTQYR